MLALLYACTGEAPAPIGHPTGSVFIAVGATLPAIDTFEIDKLDVHLDSVVFTDIGPQGPEAVSILVGYTFRPLGDTEAFGFDLVRGIHRDAHLSLQFGWSGEPGFLLEAGTEGDDGDDTGSDDTEEEDTDGDGDDDEHVSLSLEIDALELEFDLGELEIGSEPTAARLQLDPGAWIEALGVEPSAGTVSIGPGSGERYTQLLDVITSSTTLTLQPLPSELADEQAQ